MIKYLRRLFFAVYIILSITIEGWCVSNSIAVMEQTVTADSVALYLRPTEAEITSAQIGTELIDDVDLKNDYSMQTWLLVNSSDLLSQEERSQAQQLLTALIGQRCENESFHLCTFAEELDPIIFDCQDNRVLELLVRALEFDGHEAYLTDALMNVMSYEMDKRLGNSSHDGYVRVIAISNGISDNPGGITIGELMNAFEDFNIPIYTVGWERSAAELKELFAISRQTGAKYWTMEALRGLSPEEIHSQFYDGELPVRVDLPIPEHARDGSSKGIRLLFSNGAVANTVAVMPFGILTPSASPIPSASPALDKLAPMDSSESAGILSNMTDSSENGPQQVKSASLFPWLWYVLAAVLLFALLLFLIMRCKKTAVCAMPAALSGNYHSEPTATADLSLYPPPAHEPMTITLTDQKTGKSFYAKKNSDESGSYVLSVGRAPNNEIVIEDDPTVSANHCKIIIQNHSMWVRDLNSKNGTYVEQQRIGIVPTKVPLNGKISMGEYCFRVQLG